MYVANELFKAKKKSEEVYNEFQRCQKLRSEMEILNKQTKIVVKGENPGIHKRTSTIEKQIEVQFSQIRAQLREVQGKDEILKRIKQNINKVS